MKLNSGGNCFNYGIKIILSLAEHLNLKKQMRSPAHWAGPANMRWVFKARFGFRLSLPGNQEAPIQAKIAITKKKIH